MKQMIKKRFLLLAALAMFFQIGAAVGQTTFGAKAGLNLSNLSIEDADDSNLLPGFHAGLFANLPLGGAFSVQPELVYTQKGSKWESGVGDSEVKLNLGYLELPVNLVYNLAPDFDFQLGPYIGYLLSSKLDSDFDIDLDKDQFNPLDFGLQGGLRFFLKPVYLGFTYKYGLSQVADKSLAEAALGDAAHRTIQVYAAIPF